MTAAVDTPVRPSESERVVLWRLHVLIGAGFPADLAKQIAESEADLHHATSLIENGCAHEIAAAILL